VPLGPLASPNAADVFPIAAVLSPASSALTQATTLTGNSPTLQLSPVPVPTAPFAQFRTGGAEDKELAAADPLDRDSFSTLPGGDSGQILGAALPSGGDLITSFQPDSSSVANEVFQDLANQVDRFRESLEQLGAWRNLTPWLVGLVVVGGAIEIVRRQRQAEAAPLPDELDQATP
jgi:hypothetical protein